MATVEYFCCLVLQGGGGALIRKGTFIGSNILLVIFSVYGFMFEVLYTCILGNVIALLVVVQY